ncbi:MAG: 1-deoxy-D-xylulose-5-phosphate reductoisomerase [Buchnera aphidicola (Schlechtendalia peitan)]
MKNLAILGSTGSIGINVLSIVYKYPKLFKIVSLSAKKNVKTMIKQCEMFSPEWVSLKNVIAAKELKVQLQIRNIKTRVLSGNQAACQLASLKSVDYVVSAIVGSDGFMPTLCAVRSGKKILLANKESLIIGNRLLMQEVQTYNAMLLPIDSEHSAIFQSFPIYIQKKLGLVKLSKHGVKSITLTGSGGPFLTLPLNRFDHVTPVQACMHPIWSMGHKISVDSSTMMNKGLEYIEAKLLFQAYDIKIELVIHPQSIVHSMIRYVDGSMIANLSISDIRVSILYAMFWPYRAVSFLPHLDLLKIKKLTFLKPDFKKYPCLELALHAFSSGHAATIILNVANEMAVSEFLHSRIKFTDIYKIIESSLSSLSYSDPKVCDEILEMNKVIRIKINKILSNFIK